MEPGVGLRLAALAVHLGWLRPEQLADWTASDEVMCTLTQLGLTPHDVALLHQMYERSLDVNPLADWIVAPPSESQAWDVTPPPPPLEDDATHVPSLNLATPVVPVAGGDLGAVANVRRYRIRHLHASGGIGRVWLADDESLGRPVALKDLRPEMGGPSSY